MVSAIALATALAFSPQTSPQEIDRLLGIDPKEQIEIVLLGTFHFAYPGLDTLKTPEELQVDVLSDQRQKEIDTILDQLQSFAPDKIMLERQDQAALTKWFTEFQSDQAKVVPNEIYQLGFRLAKRLDHKEVFAIDASSYRDDHPEDPNIKAVLSELQEAQAPPSATLQKFLAAVSYLDKFTFENPLPDTLLLMNNERFLDRMHGVYLLDSFQQAENNAGPDHLALWWYSRNLRIYHKIRANAKPGDKVLVIIGAGHVPILREQFKANPEFRLKTVDQVLKPTSKSTAHIYQDQSAPV